MIDCEQIRLHVVKPVLEYLDPLIPYSITAENLLLGTCAVESDMGTFLVQKGGPALGIYQMEPSTDMDIYNNFLAFNSQISGLVTGLLDYNHSPELFRLRLVLNLAYATAMARIHYYRVSAPLPENTPEALGEYWKRYYNTPLGKGTVDKFVDKYDTYVID